MRVLVFIFFIAHFNIKQTTANEDERNNIRNSTENSEITNDISVVSQSSISPYKEHCVCQNSSCGCCEHVEIRHPIHFNETVCVNTTLKEASYEVDIDLIVDGKSIWHHAISLNELPSFCVPIPLKPGLLICLKIFNIRPLKPKGFQFCTDMIVKFIKFKLLTVHFGCMKLHQNEADILNQELNHRSLIHENKINDTTVKDFVGCSCFGNKCQCF